MNVQIFKQIDASDFSDSQKVFAGLLTFLYQLYPEEQVFQLYTTDVKTILDIDLSGAIRLPKSIRVGQLEPQRVLCAFNEIEDRTELENYPISDAQACTVQGYLLALYKTQDDWNDTNNQDWLLDPSVSYFKRRNERRFRETDVEMYFKSKQRKGFGRYEK